MVKYAYTAWPWGFNTREEFVAACRDLHEAGYEYFESMSSFIDLFKDRQDDFRAITDEYEIKPASFYYFFSGDREADIAALTNTVGFVEKCGAKTICAQGDWLEGRTATQEDFRYVADMLTQYGLICRDHGITPCLHPHHNTTCMYEPDIDFVMQNTDPALVGLCPDTAHLIVGHCSPKAIFERYKDRIYFTHFKDIVGVKAEGDQIYGEEVYANFRELGEGDIDFKPLFDILKSVHYDGFLCVELDESRTTNKESAAISLRYLKAHY